MGVHLTAEQRRLAWAKRQALRTGIGFTALSNGFAFCGNLCRSKMLFGPVTCGFSMGQAAWVCLLMWRYSCPPSLPRGTGPGSSAGRVRDRREYVLAARFDGTPLPGLLSDMVTVDLGGRSPQQFAAVVARKLALLPSPRGRCQPTRKTLPGTLRRRGARPSSGARWTGPRLRHRAMRGCAGPGRPVDGRGAPRFAGGVAVRPRLVRDQGLHFPRSASVVRPGQRRLGRDREGSGRRGPPRPG